MTARSFFSRSQNRFVLGDIVAHLLQLLQQLVNRKLSQAIELQFEYGVNLTVAEDQGGGGLVAMSMPYFAASSETPFNSAPRSCIFVPEKKRKRFSRASAREDDPRIILITLSR